MRWPLAFLLALAAALAFWRLGSPSLNVDEVFCLHVASIPHADFLDTLRVDSLPPLFYLLAKAWSALGSSEAWLRALPVLAHLAALALVYHWARRDAGEATGFLVGLLIACSSWVIYRSQELRPYSWLALLAAASLYFAWRRRYGLYSLSLLLGLYLHYNTGLLLPVPWLWMCLDRDARATRPLLLAQGAALLGFAPWVPMLLDQMGHGGGTSTLLTQSIYARPLVFYVADLFRFLAVGAQVRLPLAGAWGLVLVALVIVGWRALANRSLANLLAAALVAPLAVAFLVDASTGRGLFSPKHGHFLYVAVYFLAGAGLARLQARSRAATGGLLAVLLACQLTSWQAATYDPTCQNPPFRQVVRDLESAAQPTDAVVVYQPYHTLAFKHYQSLDLPAYWFDVHLEDPRSLPSLLDGLASRHPRVWLVLIHERLADPAGRVPAGFNQRFHAVSAQLYPNRAEFERVQVLLYETRRAASR